MLLHTDVSKDRLDNAQPSGVYLLALLGIDLGLHLIDRVRLLRIDRDGKVPAGCGGFAQTVRLQRAGGAVFDAGMVDIIGAMTVDLVAGITGQFFALWTEIHLLARIEREVRKNAENARDWEYREEAE